MQSHLMLDGEVLLESRWMMIETPILVPHAFLPLFLSLPRSLPHPLPLPFPLSLSHPRPLHMMAGERLSSE